MTPTTPVEAKYTKFSCPNPDCSLFNQPGQGNIVHRSWTGRQKTIERLRCTLCQKEFSEREGTLMARAKLSGQTIERLLKCQPFDKLRDHVGELVMKARQTFVM